MSNANGNESTKDFLKSKMNRCRNHTTNGFESIVKKEKLCNYCSAKNNDGTIREKEEFESKDEFFVIKDKNICESCNEFNSMYIEYPISVEKINYIGWNETWKECEINSENKDCGSLVKVRPCGKEYEDKTYLGILLGYFPHSPSISHNKKTGELDVYAHTNPCIFIPETKSIVWGMGSWWGKIDKEEDFSDITNNDINNVWYMQAFSGKTIDKFENDLK